MIKSSTGKLKISRKGINSWNIQSNNGFERGEREKSTEYSIKWLRLGSWGVIIQIYLLIDVVIRRRVFVLYVICVHMLHNASSVALRGQIFIENATCWSKAACKFSKKNRQKALNHLGTMPMIPWVKSRKGPLGVELWSFYCKKQIGPNVVHCLYAYPRLHANFRKDCLKSCFDTAIL